MAIQRKVLQPVRLDYGCDSCGLGFMRPTGMAFMTCPPQYPHRCTHCDAPQTFNAQYPTISYEEVN